MKEVKFDQYGIPDCGKCGGGRRVKVKAGPHDQGWEFRTCECSKDKDRIPGEKK